MLMPLSSNLALIVNIGAVVSTLCWGLRSVGKPSPFPKAYFDMAVLGGEVVA